jgi:hypothetical protein
MRWALIRTTKLHMATPCCRWKLETWGRDRGFSVEIGARLAEPFGCEEETVVSGIGGCGYRAVVEGVSL